MWADRLVRTKLKHHRDSIKTAEETPGPSDLVRLARSDSDHDSLFIGSGRVGVRRGRGEVVSGGFVASFLFEKTPMDPIPVIDHLV